MNRNGFVVSMLVAVMMLTLSWTVDCAATNGFYNLTETAATWEDTDASRQGKGD